MLYKFQTHEGFTTNKYLRPQNAKNIISLGSRLIPSLDGNVLVIWKPGDLEDIPYYTINIILTRKLKVLMSAFHRYQSGFETYIHIFTIYHVFYSQKNDATLRDNRHEDGSRNQNGRLYKERGSDAELQSGGQTLSRRWSTMYLLVLTLFVSLATSATTATITTTAVTMVSRRSLSNL